MTSSDLEFMADGEKEQIVGVRFPSVAVPPRAEISQAHILFDTDEIRPGQSDAKVVVRIQGEAAASSAQLSDQAHDLSSRQLTQARVPWKPGHSRSEHDEMLTPDISEIVSEIAAMRGWASGNPLTIIFTKVSGHGVRWAESSSTNNGVQTPALFITLANAPPPPPRTGQRTRQIVGTPPLPPPSRVAVLVPALLKRVALAAASVLSRADDSEEDVRDGSMYMTSSDLELMNDGNEQVVGIRFPSVPLPLGSVVVEAHVLFSVDEIRPVSSTSFDLPS